LTYQTYLSTIQSVCCDIPSVKVVAFDQETDFIVKPWLSKILNRKLEKNEVILGRGAYENYDLLDVDRSVFFNIVFDIVGVLDRTGTGLDNALLMSDENLANIIASTDIDLSEDQISLIFTKVKKGYDPEKVGRKVENAILKVDVIARNDLGQHIIHNLMDIKRIFLVTIILASLLATFLAWSVFSAIVNEREREIGIMRAIGAKGSHVVLMFVLEVLALSFVGSVVGIALGTYLTTSLSGMFNILKELSITVSATQSVTAAVLGLVVGTSICLLGAFSSILRLHKKEPFGAIKEV